MRKRLALLAAVALVLVGVGSASAQALEPLLSPTDFIIAIDTDPPGAVSSHPAAEGPDKAIDQDLITKYLNFGKEGAGLILTPGPSIIQSLNFATANDAPARDPASFQLFGTNQPIMSRNNSTGMGETWTEITSGPVSLSLSDERRVWGDPVNVTNSSAYSSYKLVFPTLKDGPATNSMQIADVQFFTGTSGGGVGVLAAGQPALAIGRQSTDPDSRHPAGEPPAAVLDANPATKYLNFGRDNAGFIVTPARGSTIAQGFQITTANDAIDRDPAAYRIFGTNAAITEMNNGRGDADAWTLVAEGTIALPETRLTPGDAVMFDNDVEYTSYKVVFTDTRADTANSVQLADFNLVGVPEPTAAGLLLLGAAGLLRRRHVRQVGR